MFGANAYKQFIEFAEKNDISEEAFYNSLKGFNRGVKTIFNKRMCDEHFLDKLLESKQTSLLLGKINEISDNDGYNCFQEVLEIGEKYEKVQRKIKRKFIEDFEYYMRETIDSLNEDISFSEKIGLINKYNQLAERYGVEKINNSILDFESIFNFGLHPDLELKNGDLGKCIIYIDNNTNFVGFNTSTINYFTLKDISESELKEFFEDKSLDYEAGAHRNITRPKDSKVQGGGVFFVKDKKVYVARRSGDFYEMNKSLLQKCFEDTEFDLNLSFAQLTNESLEEILINYIPADECLVSQPKQYDEDYIPF